MPREDLINERFYKKDGKTYDNKRGNITKLIRIKSIKDNGKFVDIRLTAPAWLPTREINVAKMPNGWTPENHKKGQRPAYVIGSSSRLVDFDNRVQKTKTERRNGKRETVVDKFGWSKETSNGTELLFKEGDLLFIHCNLYDLKEEIRVRPGGVRTMEEQLDYYIDYGMKMAIKNGSPDNEETEASIEKEAQEKINNMLENLEKAEVKAETEARKQAEIKSKKQSQESQDSGGEMDIF